MKDLFRKIWAFFKAPNAATVCLTFCLTLACIIASLTMVFVGYAGWPSYPVYALSAVALAYAVYLTVRFAPTVKAGAQRALRKRKFTRNLTENYTFRTLVLAGCSFLINLGFVAFNTVFALLTNNPWYGCLAGYYFLLSGLRGGVFAWNNRAKKKARGEEEYRRLQLKSYRLCGAMLLTLDFAMAIAVALAVLAQRPTKYTEITAIVFAAYSVYKIAFAVRNVFKAKKTKDMQIQSFRNIGLVDGAMALLSLQVTLVSTFSEEGTSMLALNAATGAFVCLFGLATGVFMIIKASRALRRGENDGK